MTYIELINRFWKLNREFSFTPSEKSVYFALLNKCNELNWKNPFNHSNAYLSLESGLSAPAMIRARAVLQEKGLINFSIGNGRRNMTEYIIKGLKIITLSDTLSDTLSFTLNEEKSLHNIRLKNKNKNKTKTINKKEKKYISENEFSALEKIENFVFENSVFQTKNQKNEKKSEGGKIENDFIVDLSEDFSIVGMELPKQQKSCSNQEKTAKNNQKQINPETEIYKKLVFVWFELYPQLFGFKPTFNALDGSKIKSIEKKLKSKCEEFQQEWTGESAEDLFRQFLDVAYSDKWLKDNFQLQILDSKFDIIIAKSMKQNQISGGINSVNILDNW